MEPFVLPDEIVDEMCLRLGVARPADEAGIIILFDRWKDRVPFDPIAKVLAMNEGRPPPGADPVEVCERWLATGVGSTCWGHVASLAAILHAADVPTRVAVDRMLIDKVDFHAFLVADVPVDGGTRSMVLDPIHATTEPLAFEAGAEGHQGPYRSGFRRDGGDDRRLLHWFETPTGLDRSIPYVVLGSHLDAADVRAFCEISAQFSGVTAGRLFARRFPPGAFVQGRAGDDGIFVLHTWTDEEHREEALHDVADLQRAFGYHDAGIELADRAGLLRVDGSRAVMLHRDGPSAP